MTFTTDKVTKGIGSCRNTRAFGPDKLSIFHLKHLGSRGIKYFTALFNDSVTSCRIPSIWKSSQSETRQGLLSQHFLSAYLAPLSSSENYGGSLISNRHQALFPSSEQHGFRPGYSTTSDLLQLTSDIATGFNQRKPPHRTVCVVVELTAAFDTVNHTVLLSKIVRPTLPEATCRWLSNYLRGRQSVTSCRSYLTEMSSIDHLHSETNMLLVKDHLNLLSAQYLVHCLDTENVWHHITAMDHPSREMKDTLFTRHNQTGTVARQH